MIKKIFHRNRRSINEMILEATRELGKCYSRIELACSKLAKRDRELFDACVLYTKKGSKARAAVYANEIALNTLKVISPALEPLHEALGEVKNALRLVANVMPSMTPEISKLNDVVNEILEDTEFNISMPMPTAVNDPSVESILHEAASLVEEELKTKIPEPPFEGGRLKLSKDEKPLVALSIAGSEVYSDRSIPNEDSDVAPGKLFDVSSFLAEELVMDYIERNNGDMNIDRCARELNMPHDQVLQVLESLKRKGKIKVQQWQE